ARAVSGADPVPGPGVPYPGPDRRDDGGNPLAQQGGPWRARGVGAGKPDPRATGGPLTAGRPQVVVLTCGDGSGPASAVSSGQPSAAHFRDADCPWSPPSLQRVPVPIRPRDRGGCI